MQGSHNSIQKQLVIKIGEEKATKHPKLTKNAKLSIGHFPGTNVVWPQLINYNFFKVASGGSILNPGTRSPHPDTNPLPKGPMVLRPLCQHLFPLHLQRMRRQPEQVRQRGGVHAPVRTPDQARLPRSDISGSPEPELSNGSFGQVRDRRRCRRSQRWRS